VIIEIFFLSLSCVTNIHPLLLDGLHSFSDIPFDATDINNNQNDNAAAT
jgi:hypothetical protein